MDYAYVTLITKPSFIRGAEFLQESLKRVNSKYPLIIMATENLINEDLHLLNNVKIIPHYSFLNPIFNRYADTINKFQAFDLIEYKKVIFLDADIFILQNIDFIFENYSSYDFLSDLYYSPGRAPEEDYLPCGGIMLMTPEKDKFKEILKHRKKRIALDDEFMLKYLIYFNYFINQTYDNKCNIFQNVGLNQKLSMHYVHGCSNPKYYDKIKISPQAFCSYDNDFLYYFFNALNFNLHIEEMT